MKQLQNLSLNFSLLRGVLSMLLLVVFVGVNAQTYRLPFPNGTTYTCSQGNGGNVSHPVGTIAQYSWDFAMPIGHQVVASRGGTVHQVVENHPNGNCSSCANSCVNQVNRIVINHGDGTYALYLHLTINGSIVNAGDIVSQGQLIGYSGNSGCSTGPHLHFMVMNSGSTWWQQSIPISFCDVMTNAGKPVAGQSYTASGCSVPHPSLISPNANATNVSIPVNLDWADVTGANAYRLQVSTSPNGWSSANGFLAGTSSTTSSSLPVNTASMGTTSGFTWSQTGTGVGFLAQPNTTYYWTVRVNVPSSGHSAYSPVRSFTTAGANITVSPSSLNFASQAGSQTFTVSGVSSSNYTATETLSWVSTSKNGNIVVVTVTPNTSTSSRTGTITISAPGASSKTVSVTQNGASASAPANDNPAGAITLNTSSNCNFTSGTNIGATITTSVASPSACPLNGAVDVFFKVQVPSSGVVTVRLTAGSLTDGIMAIYSSNNSSGSTLSLITCEDDNTGSGSNGSLMPVITINNRPVGSWLFIRVYGYGTATGTFNICALNYATVNRVVPDENGEQSIQEEVIQVVEEEEDKLNSGVSIFPIPTSDRFTVLVSDDMYDENSLLTIYSSLGILVYQEKMNTNQVSVDASRWEKGIYYVNVKGKNGGKTLKVVVQ